jgi:hypothetical protein
MEFVFTEDGINTFTRTVEGRRGPHIFYNYLLKYGCEVVSLTRRLLFALIKILGTHFC